jgi:hypothetical protein
MSIIFPRAFAFAIDDLGWNHGSSLESTKEGGPYRCGVKRIFDLKDYKAIVDVGKAVGARIQCLFILSEMDRENILSKYPQSTYKRDKWDNSELVNEMQNEIMKFVIEESAHLEFGLHGIGHEYWENGQPQKRAEWYNLVDKRPWPESSIHNHIEAFKLIMAQYGISTENGHDFPESFVPCAYSYYWNPEINDSYSFGKILANEGVKFVNTDFSQIPELNPPQGDNGGGFDNGVHVINRINYGNEWFEISKLPTAPLQDQATDFIESHWPNWLAQDDFLQANTTENWSNYYKEVQSSENRYIAKNTEQLHAQWLYNKYTKVTESTEGIVVIDNTNMPNVVYENHLLSSMVLKINLNENEHISSARLNESTIASYQEDGGYGFIYLPILEQKKYLLKYSVGQNQMPIFVNNDCTYNVYEAIINKDFIEVKLRIYGVHILKIHGPKPQNVGSDNDCVQIKNYDYDEVSKIISIQVVSTNMQGSTGKIRIKLI